MKSVVAQKYAAAAAGEVVALFRSHRADVPDGGQRRDFVFVDDCVAVVEWLLANRQVSGLFNVGSGRARSFADLVEAMFAALGKPAKIGFVDMPAELRGKYQYFTEASMEKLRAAGFDRPSTPIEAGVGRYVQDFLTRPDPYR